ncbi:MAG: RidA family protein [Patescibacteria group bacterium]
MMNFKKSMSSLPFSPFKKAGNLIFISGQVGQKEGKLVSESLENQVIQAVANIAEILKQNNLGLENVVDVTAFLVNQEDYALFNQVYTKQFSEPYPTRTTVTVKSLPLGAKVELKAIASK